MESNTIQPITNEPRGQKEVTEIKEFGKFLEEEKEEEKEPLLDGPASLSFRPATFLGPPISLTKVIQQVHQILVPEMIQISSTGGISKTTISIQSEFLSQIEIEIDHYDTDPSCFIVTFRGDEKAQEFLTQHQQLLATSLKGALPTMHCTIAPPTFLPPFEKREPNSKNRLVKTTKVGYRPNKPEEKNYE